MGLQLLILLPWVYYIPTGDRFGTLDSSSRFLSHGHTPTPTPEPASGWRAHLSAIDCLSDDRCGVLFVLSKRGVKLHVIPWTVGSRS